MSTPTLSSGIRPNPVGDYPKIDPTAFVDPSAQIMGNVHIGPKVYVGPLSVIRADEIDDQGKVQPVILEEETYIQDGVIIHARAGTMVKIGPRANIAHGVVIHGPSTIGEGCFVALQASIYNSTLEDSVWVGIGAIVMRATIPSHTMIPAGSVVRSAMDVRNFRLTNVKEEEYERKVFESSAKLRDGYREVFGTKK